MKNRSAYLVLVFFLSCFQPDALCAQDSAKILLLDDCIRIGLDQSTQILLSKDSLQITGAALLGTYGNFLPNLAFNSNYGYSSGKNLLTATVPTLVNSTGSQMNYQLTSTINIFNGLADYSALKAATLSKSASQFNLQRSEQQIAFDITQSFLQIILDRRIVQFGTDNLEASTKREAQLQELTAVGRNALSDYYQQQAETSSDKLFLIQAQQKLKNDVILLLRKIKITETDKYSIGDIPVDTLPLGSDYQNVQDLIAKALQQRPDVKSSELSLKIADWEIKGYKSGYLPKLNFEGGMVSNGGYLNQLYINGSDAMIPQEPVGKALFGQVYGELALNLSWNIFDRLYTKTNVSIAKIYQHRATVYHDDLTVQISADIKEAYNDYLAALQQIETSRHGLFAAQQAFDVVQGKYNVGQATFVELSNAQVVLLQAEVSKAQADVSMMLQKKIIDFYIGK
jgi:outer membrane protein